MLLSQRLEYNKITQGDLNGQAAVEQENDMSASQMIAITVAAAFFIGLLCGAIAKNPIPPQDAVMIVVAMICLMGVVLIPMLVGVLFIQLFR